MVTNNLWFPTGNAIEFLVGNRFSVEATLVGLRMRKTKVVPPECPLTECMSLLGGAWTPNVIWYLSANDRRFSELRRDIPAVSAKVLSARLKELEGKGVIVRNVMPTSPPSVEYSLTELGRELVPAITAIMKVGMRLKQDPRAERAIKGARRRMRSIA